MALAGALTVVLAACGAPPAAPPAPVEIETSTTAPTSTTTTVPTTTPVETTSSSPAPPPKPEPVETTKAVPPPPPPPPPPAPKPKPAPKPHCDPSYPGVCIPPGPPDLDCPDVPYQDFQVVGADPHRFDREGDGIGCES